MKTVVSFLLFILVLGTSCSRHENYLGYEELTETTDEKINLVTSDEHSAVEKELFHLINEYRLSIGLNAMQFEATTYYYAGLHTDYMIGKTQISHAKFQERAEKIAKRTGAVLVAENVAKNYDTMQEAVEGWLASPGHRKNIEGDYNYSAVSVKLNATGDYYFTQLFFNRP